MEAFAKLRLGTFAAFVGLAASVPSAAQAETWEELVAAAEKEGSVVVAVLSGEANRLGRTVGWKEDFPNIKMEAISAGSMVARVVREKAANVSSIDVLFGGCIEVVGQLLQNGLLAPIEDAIVDKSILEDSNWRNGWKAGYCDLEQKWGYSYSRAAQSRAVINWDFVDRNELKSLDDLLKPQFADKIGWYDPRAPGVGYAFANMLLINKGEDFMRKLWSLDSMYSPNHRLVAEWVVRGRRPIGLGVGLDRLREFQNQGLCKNCESIPDQWFDMPTANAGSGNIVNLANVPHPNAAKLYINWFLQQKQQQNWADQTGNASRRLGVKNPEDSELQPGLNYIDSSSEKYVASGKRALELANEVISAKAVE